MNEKNKSLFQQTAEEEIHEEQGKEQEEGQGSKEHTTCGVNNESASPISPPVLESDNKGLRQKIRKILNRQNLQ